MFIVLVIIWAILMGIMLVAEYKYYKSVKVFEPRIWQQLGSPSRYKVPFVFISRMGNEHLSNATHPKVCLRKKQYMFCSYLFLGYLITILIVSTLYFKLS
jgi:hypothetical protein